MVSIHDTKEEAVKAAKELVKEKNYNLIVLNADGTIENLEDSPIDPFI